MSYLSIVMGQAWALGAFQVCSSYDLTEMLNVSDHTIISKKNNV